MYAGHIRVCVRPSFSIVKDNKLTGVQLGYYLEARSAFDEARGMIGMCVRATVRALWLASGC